MKSKEKILITGAAGFIGFHSCQKLLNASYEVLGIDNLNDYYDVNLKYSRLDKLNKISNSKSQNWEFVKCDLINNSDLKSIFKKYNPKVVINLAAQAGVRYSIQNPSAYIK